MGCCNKTSTRPQGFCGNIAPATPCAVPSTCPTLCPEDHTQQIVVNKFNSSFIIKDSWNIPACNTSITLVIEGLTNLTIGSYFWNPGFGYFKVVGFNPDTSEVTLENTCYSSNSSVGTEVPPCTDFVVTDTPISPVNINSSIYSYVAANFTAPDVSVCIDIEVTTTNGLVEGSTIAIGEGTYFLETILDASTIHICNQGTGITPGTVVVAQNSAGEYQYPISLVITNICESTTATHGGILVCSSGESRVLAGAEVGQVPVIQNSGGVDVAFETLPVIYLDCTQLTSAVSIVSGTNSYVFQVSSTALYTAGDTLTVEGRTERFGLNVILDPTHIQVTMYPTPTANATLAAGLDVCNALDCEDTQFPAILVGASGVGTDLGHPSITAATPQPWVSAPVILTLTNTSKCRSTRVGVSASAKVTASIENSNTTPFLAAVNINGLVSGYTAVGYPSVNRGYCYPLNSDPSLFDTIEANYSGPLLTSIFPDAALALGPQESRTVEFRIHINHSGDAGWTYAVSYSLISVLVYNLAT